MASKKHHETCFRDLKDKKLLSAIEQAAQRVPEALKKRPIWPWVGEHYGRSTLFNGARLLIVAESHYEWCDACRKAGRAAGEQQRLTCWSVAERAIGYEKAYNRHWPSIENAFLGRAANENRERFWNSVAYANYILRILREESARPDPWMWEEAEKAFFPLLDELKPDYLFVLGYTVWTQLPEENCALSPVERKGKNIERCAYVRGKRGDRRIVACRLRHPRAGLGAPWHSAIAAVLSA